MAENVSEKMDYYRVKGIYVAYVSKAIGEPDEIAKSIRSELQKSRAYKDELDRIITKVETESVLAFENSENATFSSEAPARRERFEKVKALLLSQSS